MSPRLDPWKATGLVEKAWQRLEPPTRDELARRLGLKAATNLSKLNTGDLDMSAGYAARIVAVVPGLTLADLGAPAPVVAVLEPMVLDRLEGCEAEAYRQRVTTERILVALRGAGIEIPDPEATTRSAPIAVHANRRKKR